MMAILDPIKVVIDNYPKGQVEYLEVANNLENEVLGTRKVSFTKDSSEEHLVFNSIVSLKSSFKLPNN